jgi:hypothetical protein
MIYPYRSSVTDNVEDVTPESLITAILSPGFTLTKKILLVAAIGLVVIDAVGAVPIAK